MNLFLFLAGVMCGAAGALLAVPLWRGAAAQSARRRYLFGGAFLVTLAAAALLIYFMIGSRHSIGIAGAPPVAGAPPASNAVLPAAQSMESEVAALEARLARGSGSDDDWSLLARAYEFLGRAEDARRARAKIISPAAATASPLTAGTLAAVAASLGGRANPSAPPAATAVTPASAAEPERSVRATPKDAHSWLALADARRAQRDYSGARDALDKVIALHAMTAQSWADYADTVASLSGGSLAGTAGTAIDNALALDPANAKALWLKASQAHAQRHFADALSWWSKLRAVLPAGSADAGIIENNIAEDTALASAGPAAAPLASDANTAAGVSGTVSLDSRFAARVQRGATLFIYAKAADSPGPPLAVLRTTAATWPVSFRLDDSMAMLPSRRLSQFDKVVVEARISRSGQATPSSGDLYASSPVLHPLEGKKLALVINREIG